jgi:uncharacterized coiled-coil DUF342 family protein
MISGRNEREEMWHRDDLSSTDLISVDEKSSTSLLWQRRDENKQLRSSLNSRDQRSEIRDQRSEIRDQRSEIRDQRSEIRDQRSEIRDETCSYPFILCY